MSVCKEGCGGIGVAVTDAFVSRFIEAGIFTGADWEYDAEDALSKLCVGVCAFPVKMGSLFTGRVSYFLIVEGDTLLEIESNADSFLRDMRSLGIQLERSDLRLHIGELES